MPNNILVQMTSDAANSISEPLPFSAGRTVNAVSRLRVFVTGTETELEPGLDLRLLDGEERNPSEPPHPTWAVLMLILSEKAVALQQNPDEISDNEAIDSLAAFLETLLYHRERYEAALEEQIEDLTPDQAIIELRDKLIPTETSIDFRAINEADLISTFQIMLKGVYGKSGITIGRIREGGEDIDPDRLDLIELLDDAFEWVNRNLADLLTKVHRHSDAEVLLQALIESVETLELEWRFPVIGLWLRKVSKKGDRDFLNQRPELARAEYVRVVVMDANGDVTPGPEVTALSDFYAAPKGQIAQILSDALNDEDDIIDGGGESRLDFSAQAVSALQLIVARQGLVDSGIAQVAPIWRFDYLYQLATFFSQQAEQAEQRYIQFEERRANAEISRQQLSDAVSAARNELSLAETRIREHDAAVDVALERQRLASNRQGALSEEYWEYISSSSMAIQYQALAASLGGGSSGVFSEVNRHVEELRRNGETRGERGLLIGATTYLAGMEMRDVELTRMRNAQEQAGIEVEIARKQIRQESARRDSAVQLRNAVRSRYQEARALERLYEDQDLTPDVYRQLTQLMQRISVNYLSMAYEIAYLAEQAFNYEFRSTLSVITTPDDATSPTGGLLQSEILQNQLASFKLNEVYLGGEERSLVTWNVKLHELYPASYFDAIRRGRPFTFAFDVTMLDKKFPGLVDVRIENLEVEISKSRSYRITNGCYAQIRQNNPDSVVLRIQNSTESLGSTITSLAARTQMSLQGLNNRKRRPFEDSSPFCAWSFELIDDKAATTEITTMILQISGTFSQDVFDRVMEKRQTEERLLPIMLSDLDPSATGKLRAGNPLLVTVPFSIPSEDGSEPIQLFPPEEGAFPMLTGLQAVVGLSDSGASPKTLSAKVTLPFSNTRLSERTMAAEGGVEWPDDEIPANQPAVGDYEISFTGDDLEKLSGVALLLRYKVTTLSEGYRNTLNGRIETGTSVSLIFRRALLVGIWVILYQDEELARIDIEGDSTTTVRLNLTRALGNDEWAMAIFRHIELGVDISLEA